MMLPHMSNMRLKNAHLTSLEGIKLPPKTRKLYLGKNDLTTLVGIMWPPKLHILDLGQNKLTSLENIPDTLEHLVLGSNPLKSLKYLPRNLTYLRLSATTIEDVDVVWPPGLIRLDMGDNATLFNLPSTLRMLWMSCTHFPSLFEIPYGVRCLYLQEQHHLVDVSHALTAINCGQVVDMGGLRDAPRVLGRELVVALSYEGRKRGCSIKAVLVVLSSSSVPRVGLKAAVRRLHRAFLVREMAEILCSRVPIPMLEWFRW